MNLYSYQEAFGASDKTSRAMRQALKRWQALYYERAATDREDPCQRIAYTVVSKITKGVFSEYQTGCDDPVLERWLRALEEKKKEAVQLALTAGECYIKPCPAGTGFSYTLIPRNNVLVFARDGEGMPVDIGLAERSAWGDFYYTLLERRRLGEDGMLTIDYRLYRSRSREDLGLPVELGAHPGYRKLPRRWAARMGTLGLVRMKTPMLNCVDGSPDGVAVFAPAAQLIRAIDENEAQLAGEFQRGQSRILVSRDLLDRDLRLNENLFVGLDEDPQTMGITIFAPQLREQSYLARKQEYLRNVESVIGLKRGMLSDANMEERTATEIAASQADYNLTVMDFQAMWQRAVEQTMVLCRKLAELYGMERTTEEKVAFDWGNGVLYDEEKTWADYLLMAEKGLIAPEVALGWRFGMPSQTREQRQEIRKRFMPKD